MTIREKRVLGSKLISQLVLWINDHPTWECAYGEGYVAITDAADGDYDGPHKRGGAHYTGLGYDLLLYVDGVWAATGREAAWQTIGAKWESMHELCRWGGRFQSVDVNHFSLLHEGRQ